MRSPAEECGASKRAEILGLGRMFSTRIYKQPQFR
jgi:hypothetical protein